MNVNINAYNKEDAKKLLKIFTGLMLLGLLFFIVGIILSIYFIFVYPRSKGSTYGYVTNINRSGTVVEYDVNEVRYEHTFSIHNSNYYVGKKIKILYNKVSPQKCSLSSTRYFSLIGPAIGIIFLGVSGIGLLVLYFKFYRI